MKCPLTDLREDLNLTKTEMAEMLDISIGCLHNYEYGKRRPRPDIAYRIIALAKSYGMSITLEDLYKLR